MKNLIRACLLLLFVIGVYALSNQRRVEIYYVDANHFCIYMGSYKSEKLGLAGCFEGDAQGVNRGDNELSARMMKTMPILSVSKVQCIASK